MAVEWKLGLQCSSFENVFLLSAQTFFNAHFIVINPGPNTLLRRKPIPVRSIRCYTSMSNSFQL
jgi:hypothetical protein